MHTNAYEILAVNGKSFTHIDFDYGPYLDNIGYAPVYIGYFKNGVWNNSLNMIKVGDKKITGTYQICIIFVASSVNVGDGCLRSWIDERPTLQLKLKETSSGAIKTVTVTVDANMGDNMPSGGGGTDLRPAW